MPDTSTAQRLCTVCNEPLEAFDTAIVMAEHEVHFDRCGACGLILASDRWWLPGAYESAIYDGDRGLLHRSRIMSVVLELLIRSEGLTSGRFLDWAGGYGALTRMMRDRGFDYYTVDGYARNLLAVGFDGDETARYDLVSAVEVMEHIADPVSELAGLAERNDRLFFTTQLQPHGPPPRPSDWYYYALDSGQHVALHTTRSLETVAKRLGYRLTSNGANYHVFHRVPIRRTTRLLFSPRLTSAARSAVTIVRGRTRRGASSPAA